MTAQGRHFAYRRGMQFRLVQLAADPFLVQVSVFAPATAVRSNLFADGSTNGASFRQASNNAPGVTSPGFQGFPFFPNLFQFAESEHNLLLFDQTTGCPEAHLA
jgi:hypothetical protein